MRAFRWVVAVLALGVSVSAFAADKPFDPTRDSTKDLHAAMEQARAEHKNILMDVGGNWCGWCLVLEKTLHEDPVLDALLEKNYVVLHVNWSKENENTPFLGKYPQPKGFPAWYVLSPEGRLLKAETDTSELEATHKLGEGYNKDALKRFLEEHAPKPLYQPVA
jgi:thiol:disulfide interchange protein